MSRRGGSGSRWRMRQDRDPYVDEAVRRGFRSRAVFKLEQIQAKERILRRGMICVDLGASPGSWSQYAAGIVGDSGEVIAVDLLPMDPLPRVRFIQGDFTKPETVEAIGALLGERRVNLVMSDMSPNMSGNRAIDQPRSMALAEEALEFAEQVLTPGGSFVVKLFQGAGIDGFTRTSERAFGKVRRVKPRASRAQSREIYLLARDYRM